ncbi:hypothetical protein ON010_g2349 [Phytophthora cinnamomi]|nr:hypothetical protein ON010_g2349 [Phytophthora cinnamomi]
MLHRNHGTAACLTSLLVSASGAELIETIFQLCWFFTVEASSNLRPTASKPSRPMDHHLAPDEPLVSTIAYQNGKTMMAGGALALHDHVATRMEAALGKALPQVEVRFESVSITADIVVKNESEVKTELPTLPNELATRLRSLGAKKHVVKKHILKGVSGVLKQGTVTLLLGQPGSGKSSLLKVLSGRFPKAKAVAVDGEVIYNGFPSSEFRRNLPQFTLYSTEQHFVNGTTEENKAALDAARAMYKHYPDIVIQQLGLDNCQNTVVGDAMTRGVSGGERKRVTTGEMAFGDKHVIMMGRDQHGPGQRCDVRHYRNAAQPRQEVPQDSGHLLAAAFARGLLALRLGDHSQRRADHCPPHRDEADFLLDLGTNKQFQYEVDKFPGSIPRSVIDFADAFKRSSIIREMLEQQNRPTDPTLIDDKKKFIDALPEFRQNFWDSTMTVFSRQRKLVMRDRAFLVGRAVMVILMGLLYSTTFYQINATDAQLVMGIIFCSMMFVSLGQQAQIPSFIAAREVFYKQRGSNFFRTASYVLSNSVSQLPLAVVESVPPVRGDAAADELVLRGLVFLPGVGVPELERGQPGLIPDFLVWIYSVNPMAWGVRALAVNQYTASTFDVCVYEGEGIDYCIDFGLKMGEYSLETFEVQSGKGWLWYGMVFMAAANVAFMLLSYLALEYIRFEARTTFPVAASDEKHFTHVTVAFRDLWYSVPDPANPKQTIDLLKGISGYALPGTITALMGSSGAGKTTLMNVIAGRKTGGKIRGEILLNGHPATDLAIRRSTGCCEQMDIHSDSSTFREALTFSAFLCQGVDIPDSRKFDSVNECLELLGLNPIAGQIICGSSVEQMKRLTIGVELAAQPSVLFLDEPTSGLDARSAKLIMDGVRKVANTGRTVVCTIHQPSSEVFQVFDSLLLLKRGGETVFFGELGKKACDMIHYFESIEGVQKLAENYNPVTWMLEVIGAGVGNDNGDKTDFVGVFKESMLFQSLQASMTRNGVFRPSSSIPALQYADKRAATELAQARFLIQRFFVMYWRTASYNLTRFFISVFLGLLFGLTCGNAKYGTYAGINSGMGMLYVSTGFFGFNSFSGAVSVASAERLSFYRERASQTYNAFWYFVASTLVEIPYVFVSTLLFVAIFFPMVGFTGLETFLAYWLYLSLHALWHAYFGQLMSYMMPTVDVATIFGVLIISIFLLFSGFNPPGDAIPQGFKWIYDINLQRYTLAILSSIVLGSCSSDGSDIGCKVLTGSPPTLPADLTVKECLESVFNIKHNDLHRNIAFVVGFIVVYRFLTLLALRLFNHMKR